MHYFRFNGCPKSTAHNFKAHAYKLNWLLNVVYNFFLSLSFLFSSNFPFCFHFHLAVQKSNSYEKLYVIVNFVAQAHAHAEKIYVLMVRLISSTRILWAWQRKRENVKLKNKTTKQINYIISAKNVTYFATINT